MSIPKTLAPQHLGDIMSSRETAISLPEEISPMERVILTANGNVQRILSAFFNSPVKVEIIRNKRLEASEQTNGSSIAEYDRQVNLLCFDKVCCTATSTVVLTDERYLKLVAEQNVGIGQLFRYLNILPEFDLRNVGRDSTKFWRRYTLSSPGVICDIEEVFPCGLFADSDFFKRAQSAELIKPPIGSTSAIIMEFPAIKN
ncbi:hypothetical protein HDU76_007435 [Blyttiomyces sp. JEL0837]|nr:hypothetical protein HDU76_007435 [Blyttiomyces sp. JEL0837]